MRITGKRMVGLVGSSEMKGRIKAAGCWRLGWGFYRDFNGLPRVLQGAFPFAPLPVFQAIVFIAFYQGFGT